MSVPPDILIDGRSNRTGMTRIENNGRCWCWNVRGGQALSCILLKGRCQTSKIYHELSQTLTMRSFLIILAIISTTMAVASPRPQFSGNPNCIFNSRGPNPVQSHDVSYLSFLMLKDRRVARSAPHVAKNFPTLKNVQMVNRFHVFKTAVRKKSIYFPTKYADNSLLSFR